MVRLRVASYNVYLGADLSQVFGATDRADLSRRARLVRGQLLSTDLPARAEAIAALLVRERVDVVGLQEVTRWFRDLPGEPTDGPEPWWDFLAELCGALVRMRAPYDAHAVAANFSGSASVSDREALRVTGYNATLVRRGSGVDVTGSRTGDYRTRLDVVTPMDGLVFNVARGWGMVDGTRDGVAFRFVNTHTEAWDRRVRDAQRDELLRLTEDVGPALFVVGDFNAEPDAAGVPAQYQDAWVAAGAAGEGHTCGQAPDLANPVSELRRRIDYVWVRNARVTGCRVVGDQPADRTSGSGLWPSDHACVVADVRF